MIDQTSHGHMSEPVPESNSSADSKDGAAPHTWTMIVWTVRRGLQHRIVTLPSDGAHRRHERIARVNHATMADCKPAQSSLTAQNICATSCCRQLPSRRTSAGKKLPMSTHLTFPGCLLRMFDYMKTSPCAGSCERHLAFRHAWAGRSTPSATRRRTPPSPRCTALTRSFLGAPTTRWDQ